VVLKIHANRRRSVAHVARPIPTDTRGIVDPAGMMRWVDFDRFPAGEVLDGLVEWFWSVAWDLPDGVVHDQKVINHPAANVSVGTLDDTGVPLDPAEGRVYGVMTRLSNRHLTACGCALHAGFLAAEVSPTVPAPVVAEAWRCGSRQANVAQMLALCTVEGMDDRQARSVGVLAGRSAHDDVVDVTVVEGALRRRDHLEADPPSPDRRRAPSKTDIVTV
jgi:hypothetical protein